MNFNFRFHQHWPWNGAAALAALLVPAWLATAPARAQGADCATAITADQALGLATVTVSSPCRRDPGQVAKVFYDDEVFMAHFDGDGRAKLAFALVRPSGNEIRVSLGEGRGERRILDVPEFPQLYRVVLIWQAPVRLSLHVVEPGHRLGQEGDIHEGRPNLDLRQGLGKLDLAGGAPEVDRLGEQTSAEQSYVLVGPPGEQRVFSPYLDFPTRGTIPQPPYCGDGALASIPYRLVVMDRGRVSDTAHQSASAVCGESLQRPLQRIQ